MRKLWTAILASLFLVQAGFAAEETIRIGVFNCLSGPNSFGGQLELEGTRMAHKEYPEALGKKIELFVVDNKSDISESANAVALLVERDKVSAVIGCNGSSFAMAGSEVAEKAGIPMMVTSATSPLVTQNKNYCFRACFTDTYQAAGAATYARYNLELRKAALLIDTTKDYSIGLAAYFKREFLRLGGEIVAEVRYQAGEADMAPQIAEIAAAQPDIVFLPVDNVTEGIFILNQARESGAAVRFMCGDGVDDPEIASLGEGVAEGLIYTTFAYHPSMQGMNPVAKKFTDLWKEAYPDKAPNSNAALGYDAYILLLGAIERAGSTDPEAVRQALAETRNVPTATGLTTMNATHDAEKELGIMEIRNGEKIFIGTVKPAI